MRTIATISLGLTIAALSTGCGTWVKVKVERIQSASDLRIKPDSRLGRRFTTALNALADTRNDCASVWTLLSEVVRKFPEELPNSDCELHQNTLRRELLRKYPPALEVLGEQLESLQETGVATYDRVLRINGGPLDAELIASIHSFLENTSLKITDTVVTLEGLRNGVQKLGDLAAQVSKDVSTEECRKKLNTCRGLLSLARETLTTEYKDAEVPDALRERAQIIDRYADRYPGGPTKFYADNRLAPEQAAEQASKLEERWYSGTGEDRRFVSQNWLRDTESMQNECERLRKAIDAAAKVTKLLRVEFDLFERHIQDTTNRVRILAVSTTAEQQVGFGGFQTPDIYPISPSDPLYEQVLASTDLKEITSATVDSVGDVSIMIVLEDPAQARVYQVSNDPSQIARNVSMLVTKASLAMSRFATVGLTP